MGHAQSSPSHTFLKSKHRNLDHWTLTASDKLRVLLSISILVDKKLMSTAELDLYITFNTQSILAIVINNNKTPVNPLIP